jgi:hypothetical protein
MIPFVYGAQGECIVPRNQYNFGGDRLMSLASENEKANEGTMLHENYRLKCTFRIFQSPKTSAMA